MIGKGWSNNEEFDRKNLDYLEQSRNTEYTDIKGAAGEGSEVRNGGNLDGAGRS